MRRATWILGSLAVCTMAACGGGNRQETAPAAGSETGTMSSDTAAMAPGAAAMDTAMGGGTGTTGADTLSDTTTAR